MLVLPECKQKTCLPKTAAFSKRRYMGRVFFVPPNGRNSLQEGNLEKEFGLTVLDFKTKHPNKSLGKTIQ